MRKGYLQKHFHQVVYTHMAEDNLTGILNRCQNDPFRIQGIPVVVGAHGDLTSLAPHKPYKGPAWHSIEFEADDIKREWPKPPPPSATEWMHKEAERYAAAGTTGKRDVMVRDCMK